MADTHATVIRRRRDTHERDMEVRGIRAAAAAERAGTAATGTTASDATSYTGDDDGDASRVDRIHSYVGFPVRRAGLSASVNGERRVFRRTPAS